MTEGQQKFIVALHLFIDEVKRMPRFRGQTQAVRALKRVSQLAVFKEN